MLEEQNLNKPQKPQLNIGAVSSSNCKQCAFFKYEPSCGHGWCYNDNSYLSGKIRGNGTSCTLDTSRQ